MIYSKRLQTNVPVKIETKSDLIHGFGYFTRYTIKDDKITVGKVDLRDTPTGINVEYIENLQPQLYSGFGKLADQIEVEHCMKRGLKYFDIVSDAGLNSHALHYLRGKRFYSEEAEEKIKEIIKNTPKGEIYNTKILGRIRMYMPLELIEKYIGIIKKNPILLKK